VFHVKRRSFLRGAVAVGSAALARPPVLWSSTAVDQTNATAQAAGAPHVSVQRSTPFGESGVMVPDDGWRMWPDVKAEWQNDEIFLPDDVDLTKLPTNPPTGGWETLNTTPGTALSLPATVEQYHWGLTGFRPYNANEYNFAPTDPDVKNGAYYGVSWWWREIDIPASFSGRRIRLHVRAARQRAEVYLNRKLVGYSIMEELPFECDLTGVAKPGRNELAIRITNPGGRLDWSDGARMTWGHVEFQKSHGFGGLDRGMMLSAHGDVRIADAWVLNTPEPRKVTAFAQIENLSQNPISGSVRFAVRDPHTHQVLATADVPAEIPAGKSLPFSSPLSAPSAKLWDLDTPNLYTLDTSWHPHEASPHAELRTVDFGFRWFAVEGLGKNAIFRFNGRRIRLYTSISWGYWALNGLFPTPELAEKEVRAAKTLNLNTLNFHRNLAKEDVLYLQDRIGLMRCLEPGGGSQAIAPNPNRTGSPGRGPAASETAQRYMQAKIRGMIRAFRGHPCVIHYILQNEGSLDPTNPNLDAVFAMMQAEDPSRSIIGSDGFVMRSPEAWTQAYSTEIHKSLKPATVDGGAAGWWVDHTGHFSDVWQDAYYNSPTDFYFYSPVQGEIVEWGEMKGAASMDNHVQILRQIKAHGGKSYDLVDHQELLQAYESFLDKWHFRSAFPTAEQVFRSISKRAYETWGQFMENVRLGETNDMAAISGWESTAIENHSGLVDNFREFKSDPKLIGDSLLPVRPVAKQRQLVLPVGEKATFDIYLANDSHKPVTGRLLFTSTDPAGNSVRLATFDAPVFETDRFTYLIKEAFTTTALTREGRWRFRLSLENANVPTFERDLLVVAPAPKGFRPLKVGISSLAPAVEDQLRAIPGVTVEAFRPDARYDVLMASGGSQDAEKNPAVNAEGSYKPTGPVQEFRIPDDVLEAVRRGTPLLACTPGEGQAAGVARQLAQAGAFRYNGLVGPARASWMGSWYMVRQHPIYDGLPVNQVMGLHYQVKGGGSNGWLIEGDNVEIVAAYSRDHARSIGAGTLTAKLGSTPIVLHQVTAMQPVMHRRMLANTLAWLTRA
jgi:beta-galactosidase